MTSKRNLIRHAELSAILSPKIASPQLALAIQLRQMPDGGSVELLPDPFAQLDFGKNCRFYVGSLQVANNFQTMPVLLAPVVKGAALPTVISYGVNKQQENECSYLPKVTELKTISSESIAHFLPTFYCKRVNVFFHPVCPECAVPLTNAPDDVLAEHRAIQSAIYCASCYKKGTEQAVIYQDTKHITVDSKNVADQRKLIATYSVSMEKGLITQNKIPCANCSHKAHCYPADHSASGATRLLVPFAFAEFNLYLIEHAPLRIDEYSSLVSGSTWTDMQQKLTANHEFDRLQLIQNDTGLQEAIFKLTAAQKNRECKSLIAKLSALHRVAHAIHQIRKSSRTELGYIKAENVFVNLVSDKWAGDSPLRAQVLFAPMSGTQTNLANATRQSASQKQKHIARVIIAEISGSDDEGYTLGTKAELPSLGKIKPKTGDSITLYFGLAEGFSNELAIEFNVDQVNTTHIHLTSIQTITDKQQIQQLRALRYLPYLEIGIVHNKQQVQETVALETTDKDLDAFGLLYFSVLLTQHADLQVSLAPAVEYFNSKIWNTNSPYAIADQLEAFIGSAENAATAFQQDIKKKENSQLSSRTWASVIAVGMKLQNASMSYSYQSVCVNADDKWTIFNRVMSDIELILDQLTGDEIYPATQGLPEGLNKVRAVTTPPIQDVDKALREILEEVIPDKNWLKLALSPNAQSPEAIVPKTETVPVTQNIPREKPRMPEIDMSAEGTMLDETVILSKDMLSAAGLGRQPNVVANSKPEAPAKTPAKAKAAPQQKSPEPEDLEATMIISKVDLQKP